MPVRAPATTFAPFTEQGLALPGRVDELDLKRESPKPGEPNL